MARAKLTARTFSTEVTPLPGSWTFREGRAALKRLPEEYRCCYLIYNSCRFEEFGDSARYSRLHAPVETGTAPRRRRGLRITRFRVNTKARSLHRSSSSITTHFVGLVIEERGNGFHIVRFRVDTKARSFRCSSFVGTSCESFAPAQAPGLTLSAAPPLPARPACAGPGGDPVPDPLCWAPVLFWGSGNWLQIVRSAASGRAHSFRNSSSSITTRFAGLVIEERGERERKSRSPERRIGSRSDHGAGEGIVPELPGR